MIEVRKYKSEDKVIWNEFVSTAKNATFLFNRDFMDYHKDRFEDFSLMCFEKEKLVGVLPANILGDTVYSHQGLTYGGLVLHQSINLLKVFDVYKNILIFLNNKFISFLNIKIIPIFYNTIPSDELEYFLFKSSAKLIKKDVLMVIDFRNKLKFKKNRREGVNKANRSDLEIRIDNDFDTFWNNILIPNLSIKHDVLPLHSLLEIKRLANLFPKNIQQVNVYRNGKIIAGSTVFLTQTTIHPQYVSGNKEKNIFGSIDYLYDFLINQYCNDKYYFDFNTSSENDGAILNSGLLFWKEGCGARTVIANNYEVNTNAFKTIKLQLKG